MADAVGAVHTFTSHVCAHNGQTADGVDGTMWRHGFYTVIDQLRRRLGGAVLETTTPTLVGVVEEFFLHANGSQAVCVSDNAGFMSLWCLDSVYNTAWPRTALLTHTASTSAFFPRAWTQRRAQCGSCVHGALWLWATWVHTHHSHRQKHET